MRSIFFLLIASIVASCSTTKNSAGTALTETEARQPSFIFTATMANPMGGRSIPLTPYYDVVITKDSVIALLPYFGRSYTASANPQNGGIQFTSTRFSYEVVPSKKSGWDIAIKPSDVAEIQQLQLSVSASGNAILYVTSTNRQAISFNGYIKKKG